MESLIQNNIEIVLKFKCLKFGKFKLFDRYKLTFSPFFSTNFLSKKKLATKKICDNKDVNAIT